VRLLANPLFIRIGLLSLSTVVAFVMGILGLRAFRRRMVAAESFFDALGNDDPSYAYSAVIQQLKQQKFQLQNEHALHKRRAKTSEQVTAAVIANLPCGVLLVGPNGLVRQANAAARHFLGFASPLGMSPDELFRDTNAISDSGDPLRLADAVKSCLRERRRMSLTASYVTAARERRNLNLTMIPLAVHSDEASGLACVITDETAVAHLKEAQLLRTEASAEMALELRTSLSIIKESAAGIKSAGDSTAAARFANDITAETERLEKVVGGFLAEHSVPQAMAAKA